MILNCLRGEFDRMLENIALEIERVTSISVWIVNDKSMDELKGKLEDYLRDNKWEF